MLYSPNFKQAYGWQEYSNIPRYLGAECVHMARFCPLKCPWRWHVQILVIFPKKQLSSNFLFFFLLARMTTWRLELKQLLGHLWSLKKKRLECLISKKEDAWFHRAHQPWDQHLQDLPWEKLIIIICVWFTELFSCNQNLIQTNKLSCFFHMSSQDG